MSGLYSVQHPGTKAGKIDRGTDRQRATVHPIPPMTLLPVPTRVINPEMEEKPMCVEDDNFVATATKDVNFVADTKLQDGSQTMDSAVLLGPSGRVFKLLTPESQKGKDVSNTPVEKKILSPRVCHVQLQVGSEEINACVDSGATYTLLARSVYDRIKNQANVGQLKPTNAKLRGATGKTIPLDGIADITFSFLSDNEPNRVEHNYSVLVGHLQGVEMLLGIDWLISVNAQVDFGSMTTTVRLDQCMWWRAKKLFLKWLGLRLL